MSLAFSDVNKRINDGLNVNHVSKSAAYTLLDSDIIVGVDSSGGIVTVTLASAQTQKGKCYIINDEGGAAATNTITIDTEGSENIDGSATATLTVNNSTLRVYSDGAVDLAAERRRLEGELAESEAVARRLTIRLNDPLFLAKAPTDVVERERERLEAVQGRQVQLREFLQQLGA